MSSVESSSKTPATPPAAISSLVDFTSGAVGGAVGKFCEYPADSIKAKAQSQLPSYAGKSTTDLIKYVARAEGIRGFYGGVSMPAFGCAMECSVAFSIFYSCSDFLTRGSVPRGEGERSMTHDYWVVAASGGASGVVNGVLLSPLELVKCRIQAQPQIYTSVGVTIRKTLHDEGPAGFLAGGKATMIRELFGSMGFFFMIEYTQRTLFSQYLAATGDVRGDAPFFVLPVCGGAAGFGLLAPVFPIDSVKTIQQIDPRMANLGFFGCARQMYRTGGVKRFFQGFGITMMRAGPSNATIVATVEYLRGKLS